MAHHWPGRHRCTRHRWNPPGHQTARGRHGSLPSRCAGVPAGSCLWPGRATHRFALRRTRRGARANGASHTTSRSSCVSTNVLTSRELTVLEAMAEGMSNPVIAKTLHLSLSSVEKHATSIFRKLELADAPETHRRVSAVVAYRDALDAARDDTGDPGQSNGTPTLRSARRRRASIRRLSTRGADPFRAASPSASARLCPRLSSVRRGPAHQKVDSRSGDLTSDHHPGDCRTARPMQ